MLSIDGLVTGLDTTTLIDGLLQIQQQQIDRQNARRAEILGKQTAFSSVEARLLNLQGALGRLASMATTAIRGKTVMSSDEDLVTAAASANAVSGIYRVHVNSLAAAHTIGSRGVASPEAKITRGTLDIRLGSGNVTTVTIDDTNDTVAGLVEAINNSGADVTASLIDDGTDHLILLTSNETGEANQISITNNLADPVAGEVKIQFDRTVEEAANAQLTLGSGPGAISVQSADNRIEDLIAGVTLDLTGADASKEVMLTVTQDVASAREAITSFVDAYNDVIAYINDQVRFNGETLQGGELVGDRSVITIQDEVQFSATGVVSGLNANMNRLSALGISVSDKGTLNINTRQLEDALSGRIDGVSAEDVARLFALSGSSDNPGVDFVVGNTRTQEGTVEVHVTAVAERASITSGALAASTIIDSSNNQLQLVVDGQLSSTLTLADGTYTQEELAAHLEDVINSDSELSGRSVLVSLDGGQLRITSESYGSDSEITIGSGTALAALALSGTESDHGQDVVGSFIVDGVVEQAIGRGTLLEGDQDNEHTADLQVRVNLAASQLGDGPEATLRITRGIASRLDQVLNRTINQRMDVIDERFDDTLESIQKSIDHLNERFEAERQSLLEQFTALETAVSQLQTTSNFLSAQLAGLTDFGISRS